MNGAHISIVTLGVSDLCRSLAFYTALGWQDSSLSQDSVKFLQGSNVVLGLYGREALAEDAAATPGPCAFSASAIAVNLSSREEVDTFFKLAVDAGAYPQKPPQKVFWGGYSGYFRDFDGHYWEVAHNPFIQLDNDGNLDLGASR